MSNVIQAEPKHIHPAMKMTRSEKLTRAIDKRNIVMAFLSSGEVYSTTFVVARLLRVGERTAQQLLKRLVEEKMLRVDKNTVPFSNLKLWGVTAHGLAISETSHPQCPEFHVGKTNANFVNHHIDGQYVRINLERVGWTGYVPGKILMLENSQRKNKCIPDAMVIMPGGLRVALEIERHIKSQTRFAEAIAAHLRQIAEKKYDVVYYFSPHPVPLKRVFLKVLAIKVDGTWVKLTDAHRARFKIIDIDSFKEFSSYSRGIIDLTL